MCEVHGILSLKESRNLDAKLDDPYCCMSAVGLSRSLIPLTLAGLYDSGRILMKGDIYSE